MGDKTVNIDDVPVENARNVAVGYINEIIEFATTIEDINPKSGFLFPLTRIEELKIRILKGPVITTELEVDNYFHELIERIIEFNPLVSKQLRNFLDAHIDVINASIKSGTAYDPTSFIEENMEKLVKVSEKYGKVTEHFVNNPTDEITIYALFFIHIINTETLADVLMKQLNRLLQQYGLDKKYDVTDIYSVNGAFMTKNGKRTDAEVIRNALAHDDFDIIFNNNNWELRINHNNSKMTFSKDEFTRFLRASGFLYRASYIILYRIVAGGIIKRRLIHNKLFQK